MPLKYFFLKKFYKKTFFMMFTETCKSQSDFKPLKRQKNKMILNLLKFKKVVVLNIYIGMKKPPS